MKNRCLPNELRSCSHCLSEDTLCYYKEGDGNVDLYYCNFCYGMTEWDGTKLKTVEGEAYPNRDKTVSTQPTQQEEINYSHVSHVHCWNQVKEYKQELPDCGIPLEKHTQCCLCDLKYLQGEEKWKTCPHNQIGKHVIEHNGITHPTGEPYCFECGKTIDELKSLWQKEAREEIIDKLGIGLNKLLEICSYTGAVPGLKLLNIIDIENLINSLK